MEVRKPNRYTEALLKENIMEFKTWEKPRKVRSEDGTVRWEYVTITKLIDRRPYTKAFNERWSTLYKFFDGYPKTQMFFVIECCIAKSINKDSIKISYKIYKEICEEVNIKPWTQPQFSKMLKKYEEADFLEKKGLGEYNINTRYFYNGALAKQLGLDEEESND